MIASPAAARPRVRSFIAATVVATIVLLSAVAWASADASSPGGLWKTIDDETGKERSLVRIVETGGELQGTVERILTREPGDDPLGRCTACTGALRNQPVIGMTILWGLKRDGDRWAGGEILDPKNGKIYRCRIEVIDGGTKLEVRGFVGIPLLGRSQVWHRVE